MPNRDWLTPAEIEAEGVYNKDYVQKLCREQWAKPIEEREFELDQTIGGDWLVKLDSIIRYKRIKQGYPN